MVGLNKFSDKDKRRQRMRNHIARDLRTFKYRPRVVEDKRWKNDGDYEYDSYEEN